MNANLLSARWNALVVYWFLCQVALTIAYETVQDAAIIARSLVDHSKDAVGVMATVFPLGESPLGGQPFSLQEYYASCHQNGSLTFLFLPISRHSRNINHSPTHDASISISAEVPKASCPRVSLMGTVTVFRDGRNPPDVDAIRECYLDKHPDARWWLPGDDDGAHVSYWARFDPHTVYFVGGFGDEHYIGYIPLGLYQQAWPNRAEPGFMGSQTVAGRILVSQDVV